MQDADTNMAISKKFTGAILVGTSVLLGAIAVYAGNEAATIKEAVTASSTADTRQDAMIGHMLQAQEEGKKATEKLTDAVINLTVEIAKTPR